MRTSLALLAASLVSPAFAQVPLPDGGTRLGMPVTLGEQGYVMVIPTAYVPETYWVDGEGNAITTTLPLGGLHCWHLEPNRASPTDRGNFSPFTQQSQPLMGVREGAARSTILAQALSAGVATFHLGTARCGTPPVDLGRYTPTLDFRLRQRGGGTMPMEADGDIYFGARGGLARFDLATLTPSLVVTTAELEAVTGVTVASQSLDAFLLYDMVAFPDGTWIFSLGGSSAPMWVISRSPTGTLRRLHPDPLSSALAPNYLTYHAGAKAVLGLSEVNPGRNLRLPLMARFGADDVPNPGIPFWPSAPTNDLVQLLGAADGGAWARRGDLLWEISVDAEATDDDRDGLKRPSEEALGMSDANPDSDGDGFEDGVELNVTHTDPLDAGSAPAVSRVPIEVTWAPSFMAQYYDGLTIPPATSTVFVLDGGAIISGETGANGAWKIKSSTHPEALIDLTRPFCPVITDADALSRCGRTDQLIDRLDPSASLFFVGLDPPRNRVLISSRSLAGQKLFGVGADDVEIYADLTSSLRGLDLTQVSFIPDGGYLAHASRVADVMLFALDTQLRPQGHPQQYVKPSQRWVKDGFYDRYNESYLIEPAPAGNAQCGSVGSVIFVCDFAPPAVPRYLSFDFARVLVPVGPAVEPGEVLLWTPRRYWSSLAAIYSFGEGGITGNQAYAEVGWLLWRVSAQGATVEWMTGAQFIAQLSSADAALLTPTPLGPIEGIGVSPDGLHLCLAEPGANRVWALSLDATTRQLSSVRFAANGTACAFDEANTLVTLTGGALQLASGAAPVPGTATALVRQSGRWLVQREGAPVVCVGDDGVVTASTVSSVALTAALGGVAYIDLEGQAYLGLAEELCAGGGPRERLGPTGLSIFTLTHAQFSFRSVLATKAALAIRPDGMAVLGASDVVVGGLGRNPESPVRVVSHLFPSFTPLDAAKPMPGTEGLRLEAAVQGLLGTQPRELGAAAVVPGAAPGRDWGYVKRPGSPQRPVVAPVDGGAAQSDGGDPVDPTPKGCGCSALEAAAPLALLLLCTRRRRSRAP